MWYNHIMQDIIIGSDHNGFGLKTQIKQFLIEKKFFCVDVGVQSSAKPDNNATVPPILSVVKEVADCVKGAKHFAGILICGSGIGLSISANRFTGIRAALCTSVEMAKNAREHNDANILCLGSDELDFETAKKIITTFLNSKFIDNVQRYRVRRDMFDNMDKVK